MAPFTTERGSLLCVHKSLTSKTEWNKGFSCNCFSFKQPFIIIILIFPLKQLYDNCQKRPIFFSVLKSAIWICLREILSKTLMETQLEMGRLVSSNLPFSTTCCLSYPRTLPWDRQTAGYSRMGRRDKFHSFPACHSSNLDLLSPSRGSDHTMY